MAPRRELEQAIAKLEEQRGMLGDAAADTAIAALRAKLAADEQAAPGAPGGERKPVTVLFTDVVGSTALAERLDPEEWKEIISGVHHRVNDAVCHCGGTIAQFLGDGVLAFFGAPVTHEDDPIRAVRAGLAIQRAMTEYRAFLAGHVENFQMRIGIHTGLVVVGDIGSAQHREYLALGDAVNLAARLQSACAPGHVLISEATARLVQARFDLKSLGEITLKGKAEPVAVYAALSERAQHSPTRGIAGLSSPLVGRAQEFEHLETRLEQLCQGHGHIISLIGDAGIGKSRLAAELRKRAATQPVTWLEGHTVSFGQSISYLPFQEILRGYAGIVDEDNEDSAWRKLETRIGVLCGDQTSEILPYLASLMNFTVREPYADRVKYLDGEALGKQIFLTSRRFFERLAHQQPTVLVFEDLHWVDESSARLVEHLLPLVERVPLLIVGVSRPVQESPGAHLRQVVAQTYAHCYTEITLAPLLESESEMLVNNLLAIENLSPRVHGVILQKAEGNPFFLEEILRTLIEMGAIVRDDASGVWHVTAQIESVRIPDTIHGVIMARVDRLDEEVKQVLRVAAVIGRHFLYRVLRGVTQAVEQLDADLGELQRVELIRERRLEPELEYIFKHALAQEATYESILLQKRRELHAQVAEAIEHLFADRLEEFYGVLAYHFAKAEAWEKAQEYLFKAADQAGRMAADGEALTHYQQAITAYTRAFGDQWAPVQRASLERKMGEAFYRRGEHVKALEYFQRALRYLGAYLPTSDAEIRRAMLRELTVQIAHRLLPRYFVKPLQETFSPAVEEEARIFYSLAWITVLKNVNLFAWNALRRLNFAERNGHGRETVMGNQNCAGVFTMLGIPLLAKPFLLRALVLAERMQNPYALATVQMLVGAFEWYRGRLDSTDSPLERAVNGYREAGDLHGVGFVMGLRILIAINKGDFSLALRLREELGRVGEDAGDNNILCWAEALLAFVNVRHGRIKQALSQLKRVMQVADIIPDHNFFIRAGAELARCYAMQGDLAAASEVIEKSNERRLSKNVKEQAVVGCLMTARASIHLQIVERGAAEDRAFAMKQAAKSCRAALNHGKFYRPARPEAMLLQGIYDWLRGNHSAAQQWWKKSLAEAEDMGMRYDLAMTHAEMGRRLDDRTHLERAETIFAEIGAEWDWAGTRHAMTNITKQD